MAPKLRSAICAPERPASDGPTAAVERGGPRQVHLRYTRPEVATIAPTGRTSLRISNGSKTAFRHSRSGEAIGGRPDGGDRTERQGGISCRRNFRNNLRSESSQMCCGYLPKCRWQVVIDPDEASRQPRALPSWARIASTSVAPPPKLYRRGSRHQAAALRLRFRWPDLFSGCAASTDGSALPRALQLAGSQRPRKREQRRYRRWRRRGVRRLRLGRGRSRLQRQPAVRHRLHTHAPAAAVGKLCTALLQACSHSSTRL